MLKKIIYMFVLVFFVVSCESLSSVKRGLTGAKKNSTDEFLIQKKDPLILPPDYENLPTPEEKTSAAGKMTIFEKTLETSIEENSSTSNSVEDSILKKIRSK